MRNGLHRVSLCFFLVCIAIVLTGCGDASGSTDLADVVNKITKSGPTDDGTPRPNSLNVLIPTASGSVVYGNDIVSIDASNTSEGYVMVQYTGYVEKIKLQITNPDATVYTYTMTSDSYITFPLSGGNGAYHLDVLENVSDDLYALAFAADMDVTIANEFTPFLYPNQYVWFTPESTCVAKGEELSKESTSDLSYIQNVYHFVIENISYDEVLAQNIATDYIPNADNTLATGKGICFDYASLMSCMLRSQSIPTKLEVGYSGQAYHAWISAYVEEVGWVDRIIEFNGKEWSLIDPTLAANNDSSSVGQYIGDGSNYTVKYSY